MVLISANHTFITFIPKIESASNFSHFRPISLCNFYYKVVAKIVANKLNKVIDKIMAPNQSAFVRESWIT